MKFRSLLCSFTGLMLISATGCNFILEPIEQRFLFRPWSTDPARLALLAAPGNGIEEVKLPTSDEVTLHGWLRRPKTARPGERFPLVIVFGGARRETSWIIDRTGNPDHWGWLFINYRGFGLSEGDPSERVVLEDTRLIYDYAASRADVDPTKIVVLGRSLGAYFTVALANSRNLRGAILATPFDSIAAVGAERYPWLPLGLMLNGRYDAAVMAPKINIPALFVLAENDNVTPVENGAALARAWGGPQRTVTLAGARHYGVERRPEFWSAVDEFLREIDSVPTPREAYVSH
ncbi:MAG: alpha/beta hydrolase [Deltaproteobacteria bacterium]|nr:alpha/beta hydrolase [Deltaproteobacteria bacterium]